MPKYSRSIRASKGKDSLEGSSLPANVEHAVISPLIESLPTKFGGHTVVSICAIHTSETRIYIDPLRKFHIW